MEDGADLHAERRGRAVRRWKIQCALTGQSERDVLVDGFAVIDDELFLGKDPEAR